MKKVVLLYADNIVESKPVSNEPHNSIIHAMLEDSGHEVYSLYNMTLEAIKESICQITPNYIGIAVNTTSYFYRVIKLLNELKSNGIQAQIITYGFFINRCAEFIVSKSTVFDFLIKGEPELDFVDICNGKFVGGKSTIIDSHTLDDLDQFPLPFISDNNNLNTRISRGCRNQCSFCYEKPFFKKYRLRSVEHVIFEIKKFISKKTEKIPFILFSDLDFLSILDVDPKWLLLFVEEVKKADLVFEFTIQTRADRINKDIIELLKHIGLKAVALGVESGSESELQFYNKMTSREINMNALNILKEAEVKYKINFIMFQPLTKLKDIKENLYFFEEIGFPKGAIISHPPISTLEKLIILVNDQLYEYYKSHQGLEIYEDNLWVKYSFIHRDTQRYYENLMKWREVSTQFLKDYYLFLNYTLNTEEIPKEKDMLFLSIVGNKFHSIDISFMKELLELENLDVLLEQYATRLKSTHQRLLDYLHKRAICLDHFKVDFRGWHKNFEHLVD